MSSNTKKAVAIINLLVLAGTIYWNYLSNTGIISDETVGSMSDKYNSLFTPAGFTFAIWGIIYLGLIWNAFYTLKAAFKNTDNDFISKGTPWLILANITNCVWIVSWLNEYLGLSVILLFSCLIFLTTAVIKLNMEKWDAPLRFMAGVWWPIDIYFGWVIVACIANTSAYLNSIEFSLGVSEVSWTIIMIAIATLLNIFLVLKRNLREVAAVAIWAIYGIVSRHWDSIAEIKWAGLICIGLLFITTGLHAFKNRATLPLVGKFFKNRL